MNSTPEKPSPEAINALIARQIKTIREKEGLTIDAMGQGTGIPVDELTHFETGKNKIPADRLFRLAAFFNVSPNYFFEGLLPQSPAVSNDDVHQLIQNFLKVEGPSRGDMFKQFVAAVTEKK